MYDEGALKQKIEECNVFIERGQKILENVKAEINQLAGKRAVYLDLLNQLGEEEGDSEEKGEGGTER